MSPIAAVSRRRSALLGAGVGLALAAALPAGAHAAPPVPTGHYLGTVHLRAAQVRVDLRLANDGREFADDSFIGSEIQCTPNHGFSSVLFLSTSGLIGRAARVSRRGRFRSSERGRYGVSRVRGRFVEDGMKVVGRFDLRQAKCRRIRGRFRARLVSDRRERAPGIPWACDRVTVAFPFGLATDEAYRPLELGAGCTTARELARRWHAARACRSGRCEVAGATCESVRGGRFSSLAGVSCRLRTGASVELVHYAPCRPPTVSHVVVSLWAINLDCAAAAAFPVAELVGDQENGTGPCGTDLASVERPTTCRSAGGFTCRVRPGDAPAAIVILGRCVRDADAVSAFEFDYDFG
jgi:hypothetical protein